MPPYFSAGTTPNCTNKDCPDSLCVSVLVRSLNKNRHLNLSGPNYEI